ncbi:MAG: bifunctional serine/threonine-protein kinase/formylglycine-generating enzyme family protein [Planctomycetota bacterium]
MIGVHRLLSAVGIGKEHAPERTSPKRVLDMLPAYRNNVLGHGSVRSDDFYRSAGATLHEGLIDCWKEKGFLSESGRLLYIESVVIGDDGRRVARVFSLMGQAPLVLDPAGVEVARDLLPKRVYWSRGEEWTDLHPWLLFEDGSEQIFFFNGYGRGPKYLDFASGTILAGERIKSLFPAATSAVHEAFEQDADELTVTEDEEPEADVTGDFRVLGKLGEGGMGVVYLAKQESLGRLVALKTLPTAANNDPVAVGRFQREIEALARCDHPNVVRILTSGQNRGSWYYAMEFVDGADLRLVGRMLAEGKRLRDAVASAVREVRSRNAMGLPAVSQKNLVQVDLPKSRDLTELSRLFRDAALGLHELHRRGVIHRDISPANLMITADGTRLVVMDLGLAAIADANFSLTRSRTGFQGTLRYSAPELLQRSLLAIDNRVDVYSMGVTLYEFLTNRPFFDGDSGPRLVEQILLEEPVPVQRLASHVPQDLAAIVHKATEKDPRRRYATAENMAADLDAFTEGRPVSARTLKNTALLWRWIRRHRAISAAIFMLIITVSVSGFLLAWQAGLRNDDIQLALDYRTASDLVDEVARLFPVHPDTIPRYVNWLQKCDDLGGRGAQYRAALQDFSLNRAPKEEAEQQSELVRLLREQNEFNRYGIDRYNSDAETLRSQGVAPSDPRLLAMQWIADVLGRRAVSNEKSIRVERGRIVLVGSGERWRKLALSGVVELISVLTDPDGGLRSVVKNRLKLARDLRSDSITQCEGVWNNAISSIANEGESPEYHGLRIEPQLGLVPLERNSKSGLWEFWHVLSGERPTKKPDGSWAMEPETGFVMVLVPGGEARVGLMEDDDRISHVGHPQLSIVLEPFFLSKYEMTQAQWYRLTGDAPSANVAGYQIGSGVSLVCPVEQIPWLDAKSGLARWSLSLPTESQWEWVARECSQAEPVISSDTSNAIDFDKPRSAAPVGSLRCSGLGFYDLFGNVSELCEDWFAMNYQEENVRVISRRGEIVPYFSDAKVARGGSFKSRLTPMLVAERFRTMLGYSGSDVGIRPACSVQVSSR